jgi:trans-aconitate 2-methyltransferase
MVAMATWSPQTYLKFEAERTRPARELLAAIPLERPRLIFDLGCGPGNSTDLLHGRFPDAEVIGIDSSTEMLVEARRRLPDLRFMEADLTQWSPGRPPGLLFGNAVMQWVPGHLAVLERLFASLAPGGVLAVQMPDNDGEPSHSAMHEVAGFGPWRDRFVEPIARESIHAPGVYYDMLRPLAAEIDIWHTVYNHPMEGHAGIVEWVKGTGLRPYLDRIDEADREAFLAAYLAALASAYQVRTDGRVLLRFPRLFIVAVRG